MSKRLQKAFICGVSKSVLKVTVMWLSEFGRRLKYLNYTIGMKMKNFFQIVQDMRNLKRENEVFAIKSAQKK